MSRVEGTKTQFEGFHIKVYLIIFCAYEVAKKHLLLTLLSLCVCI